jgi:hypothetical protein
MCRMRRLFVTALEWAGIEAAAFIRIQGSPITALPARRRPCEFITRPVHRLCELPDSSAAAGGCRGKLADAAAFEPSFQPADTSTHSERTQHEGVSDVCMNLCGMAAEFRNVGCAGWSPLCIRLPTAATSTRSRRHHVAALEARWHWRLKNAADGHLIQLTVDRLIADLATLLLGFCDPGFLTPH